MTLDLDQIRADREAGTPGEWAVYGDEPWLLAIHTDDVTRICFMAHSNGLNDARDYANARRIARVPDLEAAYLASVARIAELEAANRGLVRLNEVTEKRYQERADAVLHLQALLDDCAEYLKDGETPRQRMDREHHDVLSLMGMLAKDRAERDAGRAEIKRLRYGLECVHQYGADTLMGPSQGFSDDRKWQRDGVLIMTRRARATLEGASEEEIVCIRADFAEPEAKINWRDDQDAIVEDDEPQIGRDYE
jgi:hypothetical protein